MNFYKNTNYLYMIPTCIYISLIITIGILNGHNWVMFPSDINYIYLLNGLNIYIGEAIGSFFHPAISVSMFYGLIIYISNIFNNNKNVVVESVIINPEIYMIAYNAFIVFFCFLAFINISKKIHEITRKKYYIYIWQFVILALPIDAICYSSFQGPESIQTIIFALIIYLCLQKINYFSNGNNKDDNEFKFIVFVSFLFSLALSTKYTSLPIIFLPLFLLKNKKNILIYFVCCTFFSFLTFMPALFGWAQYKSDLREILNTIYREKASGSISELLKNIIINIYNSIFHDGIQYFSIIYIFSNIISFYIIFFPKEKRKNQLLKFIFSLNITLFVFYLMVISRIKTAYFVPYALLLGIFLSLNLYLLSNVDYKKLKARLILKKISKYLINTSYVFLLIISLIFINNLFNGCALIYKMKIDAVNINKIIDMQYNNTAIIFGIQASNKYVSLIHANPTSGYKHNSIINKVLPDFFYDYRFDGSTLIGKNGVTLGIKELLNNYNKILFWSNNSNFEINEWRIPPDAFYEYLYKGEKESLVLLTSVNSNLKYDKNLDMLSNNLNGSNAGKCIHSCDSINIYTSSPIMLDKVVLNSIESDILTELKIYRNQNGINKLINYNIGKSNVNNEYIVSVNDDIFDSCITIKGKGIDNIKIYQRAIQNTGVNINTSCGSGILPVHLKNAIVTTSPTEIGFNNSSINDLSDQAWGSNGEFEDKFAYLKLINKEKVRFVILKLFTPIINRGHIKEISIITLNENEVPVILKSRIVGSNKPFDTKITIPNSKDKSYIQIEIENPRSLNIYGIASFVKTKDYSANYVDSNAIYIRELILMK